MGYFIKNQLPEREAGERLDLWLGLVKDVHRVWQKLKIDPQKKPRPRIVSNACDAVGYHCPLRIHLCGLWPSPNAELQDIKYLFERMDHAKMMDIEWVRE